MTRPLHVCLDVAYRPDGVVAACVGFHDWTDAAPALERVVRAAAPPAAYEPGAFYRRELPYLVAALAGLPDRPALVVVDAHVWLGEERPGLGARLYEALDRKVAVVGVAKSGFHGAPSIAVTRGTSARPLHVSAVGVDAAWAAERVRSMHGPHRLPTLLKRADQLARR